MDDVVQAMMHDGAFGVATYRLRVADKSMTWSDALLRLVGRDEPPTEKGGLAALAHLEDRPRAEAEMVAALESGAAFDREFRIPLPDGGVRMIHDRGVVERDDGGAAVAVRGMAFDVTRHREANRPASPSLDHRGVAIYEYDIASRRAHWTPTMWRLLGLTQRDTVDPHIMARETMVEEDVGRFIEGMEAACRRLGPFEMEYRVRTDRGVRWLLDRGETIGPIDPATGLARLARGALTDVTAMKEAERRLEAAGETFRHLVERAPFGVYIVDADLRMAHVSEGARAAFAQVEPLIGRHVGEALGILWPEAFAAEAVGHFRHTLKTGEPYHAPPLVERRRDLGRMESYDWSLARIALPDGRPGVLCHFYDLSQREADERALRDALARLELAYEASDMGAWDVDTETGGAVWSPHLYALLGLDPTTPPSPAAFFARVHPDDRAAVEATFQRTAADGDTFKAAFRIVRPDGAVRDLAGRGRVVAWRDGRPTRMIGVNYDITERRDAERRLQENESRLRLILDSTIAFTGLLDRDGVLREVNQPALQAAGLARDAVIGRPLWKTFWWTHDAAEPARLVEAFGRALTGETTRFDTVVRMANDTRMTVDFMLAPIMGKDGRAEQIVASAFDVTEREQATAHAKMLMQEINHRSKNMLTLVQIIARRSSTGDPEAFLARLERRIGALAAAQDLLVCEATDSVPMNELIRSQMSHFSDLIGKRVTIDGPPVRITAEGAQAIGMVFHELATNAGKYGALSNDSGTVTLRWWVEADPDAGPGLALSWREAGGPPVTPPTRTGFGSIVTQQLLANALTAEVAIDYAPGGVTWRATCRRNFLTPD